MHKLKVKKKRSTFILIFREKKPQAESFLNKGKWKVAFELVCRNNSKHTRLSNVKSFRDVIKY